MVGNRTNLVNLERASKAYGVRALLDAVSLGVGAGQRVGVVGRNGEGKSTLLDVVVGRVPPDTGRVSRAGSLRIGHLAQHDTFPDEVDVATAVLGGRADHDWAQDARAREIVEELVPGVDLTRPVASLSGGERRRCALAAVLLGEHDLLVLDEPTNHLDIEVVDWLARHVSGRPEALLVVTHDRWFLDATCEETWEVHDGAVDRYDGGYAAYVLARAERERQEAVARSRHRSLVRKELAWLRRGPPARTSKPRFRVAAASALVAQEPPARDALRLERFATHRLGKDVLEVEDVDLTVGTTTVLSGATWRLGPGERVGLIGVNGAGKTSVLRLLSADLAPDRGRVRRGRTVALGVVDQDPADFFADPQVTVRLSVAERRAVVRTADGELSATSLLERFGFTGDRLNTRVAELSGGERRRLQILHVLLEEPNVLLLDEPTNDLDIETLRVVEDYLDGWPGTLVVVSHDRYFLERTCDRVAALLGDGSVAVLPGGVEEYLRRRRLGRLAAESAPAPPAGPPEGPTSAARQREARKALDRLERQVARLTEQLAALDEEMTRHATDPDRLADLAVRRTALAAEREAREDEWLAAVDVAEGG